MTKTQIFSCTLPILYLILLGIYKKFFSLNDEWHAHNEKGMVQGLMGDSIHFKEVTYKSQEQVHVCGVFLQFEHQSNQESDGQYKSHHQKLWPRKKMH